MKTKMRMRILLNLIAAVGYFLGGWLGTLLATPPSNSSLLWPAAGCALAIMLRFGHQALPGIFIGALIAQFYAFLDTSSLTKITQSLDIGLLASIGACLQAWVGMRLINRWVGKHDALIEDSKIVRFFLLMAVSCLVSASIGVSSLYWRGVISDTDVISSWATWWAGDTIGTAIFTPLLLLFFGKPKPIWQGRRRSVLYIPCC